MPVHVPMSPESAGLSLDQEPAPRIFSLVDQAVILSNRLVDRIGIQALRSAEAVPVHTDKGLHLFAQPIELFQNFFKSQAGTAQGFSHFFDNVGLLGVCVTEHTHRRTP